MRGVVGRAAVVEHHRKGKCHCFLAVHEAVETVQMGTAIVVGSQVELTRIALALVAESGVLVLVMPEVLRGFSCLVLAIDARASPCELEGQDHQEEDHEQFLHRNECTRDSYSRSKSEPSHEPQGRVTNQVDVFLPFPVGRIASERKVGRRGRKRFMLFFLRSDRVMENAHAGCDLVL